MIDILARKDYGATVSFKPFTNYCIDINTALNMGFVSEGDDVIVNVHGYNSTYEKVRKSYTTLEENLPRVINQRNIPKQIGFWWPASWSSTVGFMTASMRVPKAVDYFLELQKQLRERKCRVTIQAHSLGCRLVTDAIKEMTPAEADNISRAILTAPAMATDYAKNFVQWERKPPLYHVMFSRKDPVLGLAYRLVPANWKTPAMGAIGPSKYNIEICKPYDMSTKVWTHSGYKDTAQLYELMLEGFGEERK